MNKATDLLESKLCDADPANVEIFVRETAGWMRGVFGGTYKDQFLREVMARAAYICGVDPWVVFKRMHGRYSLSPASIRERAIVWSYMYQDGMNFSDIARASGANSSTTISQAVRSWVSKAEGEAITTQTALDTAPDRWAAAQKKRERAA